MKVNEMMRAMARFLVEEDPEVLYAWFGNSVAPDRGRPTVGQFLSRMADEVRERVL